DRFQLQHSEVISQDAVGVRPGNVLVAVRDYNTLAHLECALDHTDTERQDIVVMTVRLMTGDSSERGSVDENLFAEYEQRLFTRVVALAERHGKPVDLVIVSAANVFDAVAQTAVRLDSAQIIAGLSAKMTAQGQARELGRAWERLVEKPRRQVEFSVAGPGHQEPTVYLGAHAPRLTDEDLGLIHEIWLQVSQVPARQRVHHRDVVRVALERLKRDLKGRADVMLDFYKQERKADPERDAKSVQREPEHSRLK
ncbi:MAG TPA: APC family permease, partial [Blastocatellia bacterium]|nr:APC family permease [Blastocatellia bacterium]